MPTSPSEPVDPALQLAERFQIMEHVFSRWVQSLMEGGSVTPTRLRLLGVLHCRGPQIMCDLSDQLGVTARNVTALVDALEHEGMVRRTPHATDRRATVVELTAQGFESATVQVGSFTQKIAALFRDLPQTDQHELLRLVDTLLISLQQRGQGGRGG